MVAHLYPTNQHRAQSLAPSRCPGSVGRTDMVLRGAEFEKLTFPPGISISIGGLAPLIIKPGVTFTPWPRPLLPLLLSFNSGSLTNPSFQEREADLLWGRASGAVCVGTTRAVILRRQ